MFRERLTPRERIGLAPAHREPNVCPIRINEPQSPIFKPGRLGARSQDRISSQHPEAGSSHVFFSPLSKAAILPDIVVFVGKPGSLHHLMTFAGYWEGGSMKAELSGPACRTGIAYLIATGQIGL
jgi:hypothetical protein